MLISLVTVLTKKYQWMLCSKWFALLVAFFFPPLAPMHTYNFVSLIRLQLCKLLTPIC